MRLLVWKNDILFSLKLSCMNFGGIYYEKSDSFPTMGKVMF